jgi:hypothetical protein
MTGFRPQRTRARTEGGECYERSNIIVLNFALFANSFENTPAWMIYRNEKPGIG